MKSRRKYNVRNWDNLDVSYNRIGRGGTAASGAFGDIPQQFIDKKYEQTKILEDPYETDNFNRSMLTYNGPDPELFEEEARRFDNHSAEQLSVRYSGARSELKPYHPDLFLGFTEADPRGTSTDPDMRKAVDQGRFRAQRYTRFYNDADYSVPESGLNEQQVIANKRKLFYNAKNRMKWFSTSKDGRHNGGPLGARLGQDIVHVTPDGQIIDLTDTNNHIHRGDKTTILSNYLPTGWYRTTDHEFKVAKYGIVYKSLNADDIDIRGLQNQTKRDNNELVEFRGNVLPKAIVQVMKRIATERTENLPAHFQLSMEEKIRTHKRQLKTTRKTQEGHTTDHDIVESMIVATKAQNNGSEEVRYAVQNAAVQSDNAHKLDFIMDNTRQNDKARRTLKHRQMSNTRTLIDTKDDTRNVANYSSKKVKNKSRIGYSNVDIGDMSERKYDAEISHHRRDFHNLMGRQDNIQSIYDYAGEADLNEFADHLSHRGRMENAANTRSLLDREDINHDMLF